MSGGKKSFVRDMGDALYVDLRSISKERTSSAALIGIYVGALITGLIFAALITSIGFGPTQ